MQTGCLKEGFLRNGTLKLSVVGLLFISVSVCSAGYTKNIMLTGYWPPTNEMLVKFSTDPILNPGGWQGQNWEGRGYDVYAYFPTFPGGTGSNPKGDGDFEVNYQDTSDDFWRITGQINPVAILSYGQGAGPWELENYAVNRSSWYNSGYSGYPNPSPPDSTLPAGSKRYSTLPMEAIRDAIDDAGIGVDAWIDNNNGPGTFLCAYMAYHGMWYQSLHSSETDPYRSFAAGFTHVSSSVTVSQAILASEITLRVTIDYLDSVIPAPEPATICLLGLGALALLRKRRA